MIWESVLKYMVFALSLGLVICVIAYWYSVRKQPRVLSFLDCIN